MFKSIAMPLSSNTHSLTTLKAKSAKSNSSVVPSSTGPKNRSHSSYEHVYPKSIFGHVANSSKQIHKIVTSKTGVAASASNHKIRDAHVEEYLKHVGAGLFKNATSRSTTSILRASPKPKKVDRETIYSVPERSSTRFAPSSAPASPDPEPQLPTDQAARSTPTLPLVTTTATTTASSTSKGSIIRMPSLPLKNIVITKPRFAVCTGTPTNPACNRPITPEEKARNAREHRSRMGIEVMDARIAANSESINLKRAQLELKLLNEVVPKVLGNLQESDKLRRSKVKVVIVGAGLAGLSAAHSLVTSGFTDVIVLEAQQRAGGRIHSVSVSCGQGDNSLRQMVDLGCPGIDGTGEDNSLYTLAVRGGHLTGGKITKQWNSTTRVLSESRQCLDSDVTKYTSKLAGRIKNMVDYVYQGVCQSSPSCDVNLSGKDYGKERTRRVRNHIEQCSISGQQRDPVSLQEQNLILQGFVSQRRFVCDDAFSDSNNIAAHLLGIHKPMEEEDSTLCLPSGMQSLVEMLLQKIGTKKIKYEAVVNQVDYKQFNVKNIRERNDCKVLVTCKNGKVFKCDHIIMTASLGFLKQRAKDIFSPPLSEEKLKAIRNVGWASTSRAIVVYDSPISSPNPVDFIWPGLPCKKERYPLFRQPASLKSHPIHRNILELSSRGNIENVSDDDIAKEVSNILKSNNIKAPDVVTVHKSRWMENKFMRGTKPYLTTECSGRETEVLEEPIMFRGIPVVMFAGDSTYKNYRCLAHAARASGLREAARISNIYNELHRYQNKMD